MVAALLAILVEVVVLLNLGALAHGMSVGALFLLHAAGVPVGTGVDHFLWMDTAPVTFSMPNHSFIELFVWIIVGGIGILVVTLLRIIPAPLRYFINLNLLIVLSEATYLYFMGHLGYDSNEFSILLTRTAILTWLIVPLFVGVLSALFPLTIAEQLSLLLFCSGYNFLITTIRYAVFIAILSKTGPILMADLYLLYGPLLDIVPLVAIYSMFLVRLACRLERTSEGWAWL